MAEWLLVLSRKSKPLLRNIHYGRLYVLRNEKGHRAVIGKHCDGPCSYIEESYHTFYTRITSSTSAIYTTGEGSGRGTAQRHNGGGTTVQNIKVYMRGKQRGRGGSERIGTGHNATSSAA